MIRKWPTWLFVLLTLALAITNAIVFPLWTGYQGGTSPLPAGIEPFLPFLIIAAVNAGVFVLLYLLPSMGTISVRYMLLLTAATRIAYLVMRNVLGAKTVDGDVTLFFNYGHGLIAGRYLAMEYPQGGLLYFAGAYLLAAGRLGNFRTVLPLLNLPFDLITVTVLLWLGRHYGSERTASAVGLVFALSPFTLIFWYGKYDSVPAALFALSAALLIAGRRSLSALGLGIGFLVKWLPGIAVPFFVLYLWRAEGWRAAFKYTLVASAMVALPIAAFWAISPARVTYTYTTQATRPVMGASSLYIPIYFLEPKLRLPDSSLPWESVHTRLVSTWGATFILVLFETAMLLGMMLTRVRQERALALAGLGVVGFILLNRVFSPQYMLVLCVGYALGLIALSEPSRFAPFGVLILLTLTFLNYLIWPVWVQFWFPVSVLFFALNFILAIWLFYAIIRAGPAQRIQPELGRPHRPAALL